MENNTKIPGIITVFAILSIIAGISLLIITILMLLKIIESSGWEYIYPIFALFAILIAYGFLTAKNWARITFIIYLLVGICYYILENYQQPVNIVITIISTIIVIYILTRPDIKKYFTSH